ncbi:hypothetical protein E2562_031928 [Oryza meyeriana var. granulata]|uniref:Uncharacterized protein n=1 Tax=Oryza meyeriana var. granulata TaxID=110450 RepID=A0A6G1DPR2_9ORYZ|nr:hypothetical protein E2562_031928 [Oryza meyeriana var. granulata]
MTGSREGRGEVVQEEIEREGEAGAAAACEGRGAWGWQSGVRARKRCNSVAWKACYGMWRQDGRYK